MAETEDEWIDKSAEERLGIIAKYDKGREEGALIDPWEDPAFEIYHVTDHYGFIHDKRFPLKFEAQELKRLKLEVERSDKWVKMHMQWNKFKNSEKLKLRTYKGIPNKVRGLFWSHLLDLDTLKVQQKGKYEEMSSLARKHSPDVRQIDLDVNRTYRDHIMFRERYGLKQQSLFNILCAYSIYNSEVGYCQGMSQVAALLLVYLDEEDSFWALAQLMTHFKYGMHGFFIAGFPKLVRFQAHHDKILATMLPRLRKHFDLHGIDSGLYTLKWFFQCFLDRVPFELALRLWDIYLLEGEKVLICGAYTILKIHQKQLLARKNMDDILNYIQSTIPNNFGIDNDTAINNFSKALDELHRKKLDTAGDPSDEELPKKPFGIIESPVKTTVIKKEEGQHRMSKELALKKEQRAQLAEDEDIENEEDYLEENSILEKASASRISLAATSVASSSIADSPRNMTRPLSSISNRSYTSAVHDSNLNNGPVTEKSSTPVKMNGISGVGKSMSPPPPPPRTFQPSPSPSAPSGRLSAAGMDELVVLNAPGESGSQSSGDIPVRKVPPPVSPRKSMTSTSVSVESGSTGSSASITSPSMSIPVSTTVRIHVPYSITSPTHTSSRHNSNNLSAALPPVSISPLNGFDLSKNDPNRIKIDVSSHSTLIQ